jgi:hypothetical protein
MLLNGPYALLLNFGQLTGFGAILIAAIFGPAILRDFRRDTYALIFTKPVTKFDYLGGKWAALFVVTIFVFSGGENSIAGCRRVLAKSEFQEVLRIHGQACLVTEPIARMSAIPGR